MPLVFVLSGNLLSRFSNGDGFERAVQALLFGKQVDGPTVGMNQPVQPGERAFCGSGLVRDEVKGSDEIERGSQVAYLDLRRQGSWTRIGGSFDDLREPEFA